MVHNWTEKDVAGQPVKAQGYFNAWPEIVRTKEEIRDGEPMPLRLRATPDAILRMEQTLKWISHEWRSVNSSGIVLHANAGKPFAGS
ncbi:MAG: hypothetical protein HRT36_08195 [Alphaproteobacteria bacterium]|nr:hypothetical protein [Alphaproteobacteria bacterium]